jgi:hypothetical protein
MIDGADLLQLVCDKLVALIEEQDPDVFPRNLLILSINELRATSPKRPPSLVLGAFLHPNRSNTAGLLDRPAIVTGAGLAVLMTCRLHYVSLRRTEVVCFSDGTGTGVHVPDVLRDASLRLSFASAP